MQFWLYPQPRSVKCGAEPRQRVRWEAVSWLPPVSSCFLWPAGPDAAGSLSTQPGSGVLGQRSSAEYLEAWCWVHLTVLFCSTVSAGGSGPRHVGQRAVQNKCYETLPLRNHFSCLPERIVGACYRCPNLAWSIEIASPPTESSGSLGLTSCCSWRSEVSPYFNPSEMMLLNSRRGVQGGSASGTCALLSRSLRLHAFDKITLGSCDLDQCRVRRSRTEP